MKTVTWPLTSPEAPLDSAPEKRLRELLTRMGRTLVGLRALVISDPRGLAVMAHRLAEAPTAAAMGTLVLSSAQRLASNLQLAGAADVLIEGDGWKALIQSVGGGFSVLYVLSADVNLELLRSSADGCRTEMREVIADLVRSR